MLLTDPSQLPDKEPDDDDEKESRSPSTIIASFIVDGFVQIFMTWWFTWVLWAGFGYSLPNPYLWWAGTTLFYVTLNYSDSEKSGRVIVRHVLLLIFLTVYTWIFK